MNTMTTGILLGCILGAANCGTTASIEPITSYQDPIVKIKGISQTAAIETAKETAFKTDKSLQSFGIVACEEVLFWRIIFDGSGVEYVMDKKSGRVIKVEQISHGPVGGPLGNGARPAITNGITEQDAIKIAKRNLRAWYVNEGDAEWFVASACELAQVWRVVFDIRLTIKPGDTEPAIPSGNTWQYSVDKKTGEILQKQKS